MTQAQSQSQVDISRITKMTIEQVDAYEKAVAQWTYREKEGIGCTAVYQRGRDVGKRCLSKPGKGTSHEGWGPCVAHGGAKKYGRALGAWLMAHAFAEEYDLSPWESLLYVIRITAGRVRYCERVLAGARDDRELEGGSAVVRSDGEGGVTPIPLGVEVGGPNDGAVLEARDLSWWVTKSETERILLAKVSKAAIDAGVAQLLVTREIEEGEKIAAALIRVYDELEAAGASKELLTVARESMKREMLALEAGSSAGSSVGSGGGQAAVGGPNTE